MLLLAVDTSGKNGSVALARAVAGEPEIEVLDVMPLTGGAFSAQLIPQIASLLEKQGVSKNELGAFVVASGPGSFTGLRVGLGAIKALAESLQKPIAAVSLLEAVARSGGMRGRVFAVLDAGREDVYVGDYELDPALQPQARRQSERLLSLHEFIAEAKVSEAPQKTVVTPEPVVAGKMRAVGLQVEVIDYPDSGALARFGWEHLERGDTVGAAELEANYLRRTDAEIFSKPAS
jgi:tRNA threonylcarbamoyladenosine biosynthesis protein TsaB